METVREVWTDERMDDLNHKVDELAAEMRAEFRAVRSEFGAHRAEFRAQLTETNTRFDTRFDAMQRTMIQLWATSILTTLGCFATLFATRL